ncbi:MAG: phosphoglycerate kinase [Patescibacteria group bacterium]
MKLKHWTAADIGKGTRVLVRLDVNVPVKRGQVQDGGAFGRIAQALPEIEALRKRGARIILAAHLGDPGGKVVKSLSLGPVAKVLATKLKRVVPLVTAWEDLPELRPGGLCLLENLRFDPGEEKNDDAFAWKLAKLADVYVNNAFGVCHRRHASVHAVTRHLPSFAGELVRREVEELSAKPVKPFVLVMGGAKIATKINVLRELGPKADKILLGGGLAVTFLAAADVALPAYPADLMQPADVAVARKLLRQFGRKLVMPVDLVAKPKSHLITDIGPETIQAFLEHLAPARTIIWNGPLGIIERPDGQAGTLAVTAGMLNGDARTITGGGETVTFLDDHKLIKGFTHVSTGGGAMLAFLAGEALPGLVAIQDRD